MFQKKKTVHAGIRALFSEHQRGYHKRKYIRGKKKEQINPVLIFSGCDATLFTLCLPLLQSLCRDNFLDNTGLYFEAVATLLVLCPDTAGAGTTHWGGHRSASSKWIHRPFHTCQTQQGLEARPFTLCIQKIKQTALPCCWDTCPCSWLIVGGLGVIWNRTAITNLFTHTHKVIQIGINPAVKRPTAQFSSSEIRVSSY